MKTFYIKTLGCKVNQYETQLVREQLLSAGCRETETAKTADLCIINTCTVTHESDRKSLYYVRKCKKENPETKICLMGCLTENGVRDRLEREGTIDYLVSNEEKKNITTILFNTTPAPKNAVSFITTFDGHTRAFVKIQDGCNMKCTYCKVRLVRGTSRSRARESIVAEVTHLVGNGYQEIVLTGIHLGAYGADLNPEKTLISVLEALDVIPGLARIRLSSIEPIDITDELIAYLAGHPRVCPHLHMPLQSGDDVILRAMQRVYTRSQFKNSITALRKHVQHFCFSTDVIVGFPGETDEAFENTCEILTQLKPIKMHIFPFSPREGTVAYDFPGRVNPRSIKEREVRLMKLDQLLFQENARQFIGTTQPVLFEECLSEADATLIGMTPQYMRVQCTNEKNNTSMIGTLNTVQITGTRENILCGEIV